MASVGTADVVFGGDSRVFLGVDPEAVSHHSELGTVVNFGFSSTGYSNEYLGSLKGILMRRGHRVIVLGVTPHSLTQSAVKRNTFLDYQQYYGKPLENWEISLARLKERFAPITFASARNKLAGVRVAKGSQVTRFCENGFAAKPRGNVARKTVESTLRRYKSIFNSNTVDESIIRNVLHFCRECRELEISVVAFRPCTSPEMVDIENRASGFDEVTFAAEFEAVGGVWLKLSDSGLVSYDASHLDEPSAQLLSIRIGKALRLLGFNQGFQGE
jgi:hypothetical protein